MELKDISNIVDESIKGLEGKNKEAITAAKADIIADIEAKGFQSKEGVESAIKAAVSKVVSVEPVKSRKRLG